MEVAFSEHVSVSDPSSVGEVRRTAMLAAQRLNFTEKQAGDFALVATEASRNVLLHGGGGQVVITGIRESEGALGRILAMDKGPGIANMAQAMSDGYSTAGTMGAGMGAMKRNTNLLEIFTGRGGTIVLLQVGEAEPNSRLEVAGLAVPYPGERLCGDAWACVREPERTVVMIADGLGHGFGASEAAQEAVATFRKRAAAAPGEIIAYLHDALKKTRGAVAAVAEIRPGSGKLVYAGVGNISASVITGDTSRSLVSHNGTLGVASSRIQEFPTEWARNSVLIMHSDGLTSKWDLKPYPGLLARHPAVIGGALLRDFRRQRDDASVLVVKAA